MVRTILRNHYAYTVASHLEIVAPLHPPLRVCVDLNLQSGSMMDLQSLLTKGPPIFVPLMRCHGKHNTFIAVRSALKLFRVEIRIGMVWFHYLLKR
jgi:hypothetical protein